ncbi:hypothetical protein GCM10022403_042250 [Streptomyces coacervatus]|uniref:OmpR/PhoB-type domain-containing protein n=1 Tax=Streptomyces coacervatus TaxID=647381 RepID=A0ABP7I1F9_9ACTN|nr:AfsR/SARP family transcriptional regulator [Streptomyces coacervatus]MDF2267189.1 AfsR/SARP family transcriptional regulator [Streptomyces coacervatus]
MYVELLGPFQAGVGETSIVPTAGKPRNLLALFALNPGILVTNLVITEELWAGHPPRRATSAIHAYVMRLRHALASALPCHGRGRPDAKEILQTVPGGYVLRPGECFASDAADFRRLVDLGNRRGEAGDRDEAARLLHAALGLWRGPALADLQPGPVLEREILALEERRRTATERRIALDLELGRHHLVLDELTELTARNRTHEYLHALHMVALQRSGRRTSAIELFERLRRDMEKGLGTEPAAWINQLRLTVLDADANLDNPLPKEIPPVYGDRPAR